MPPSFPAKDFRAFGTAASAFFPSLMSDGALYDSQEKKTQFDWSWQAVRYRYRTCVECNDEFKSLLANASEMWLAGWGDEELTYKLEHCIYLFFMSGLSVFDSFAFCLYFLGHAIQPEAFPKVANPRDITRKTTSEGFEKAFPQAVITGLLGRLSDDARFMTICTVRNLVGHRISGRRSVHSSARVDADGIYTTEWHEERWHLPGAAGQKLIFGEELLQCRLNDITDLLTPLTSAARVFVENLRVPKVKP